MFVYNRPSHTLQTLQALAQNELAKDSLLYIYADGPKENADENDLRQILETRQCIRQEKWCKDLVIIESEKNKGLATSIIEGVTEVVNKHGKIIVLEDDIVTSRGFLKFMNDALDVYVNEEKVWHVSGYWYPVKGSYRLPKTFFFNAATCWGWATWERAWANLIIDPKEIQKKVLERKNGLYHFDLENGYPFSNQLQMNINGAINTWAVKWYGTMFINNAFSLHPNQSLTNNIGFDASGSNCEESSQFTWKKLAKSVIVEHIPLVESTLSRKLLKPFFNPLLDSKDRMFSLFSRLKNKAYRLSRKLHIKLHLKNPKQTKDEFEYLRTALRFKPQEVALLGNTFQVADGMSFYYSYKEIFEEEIYKFQANSKSPLIIDCGCNYGTSILYFKHLYPDAEVIGFEPDPIIFKYAKANVTRYGLKKVTLENKGLWKEENTLRFASEGADGGRLSFEEVNKPSKIVMVETVLLSRYLENKQIDFLKIDIEGAEVDVLLESEKHLNNVSNIFVEYHSFAGHGQRLDILLSLLTRNGFRYQIERVGKTRYPFLHKTAESIMDLQLNIFAFREQLESKAIVE